MPPTDAPPLPTTMPVDRAEWSSQLHLSNFVNSYYQYRDVQSLPGIRKILVVGPGQGLDTLILRWRGYEVTTLDIDETFRPDHVGSVHEMPFFGDAQFDVVIASHVIEHFAVAYLDQALRELARVAGFALIYVPVHGLCLQARFFTNFRGLSLSPTVDLFNFFERPDGVTPRYMEGQHFWELGMRGFRVRDLRRRFSKSFEVLRDYRNRDWTPSYNFVLQSRQSR
jgi:SAM-dependent methyltransferase